MAKKWCLLLGLIGLLLASCASENTVTSESKDVRNPASVNAVKILKEEPEGCDFISGAVLVGKKMSGSTVGGIYNDIFIKVRNKKGNVFVIDGLNVVGPTKDAYPSEQLDVVAVLGRIMNCP